MWGSVALGVLYAGAVWDELCCLTCALAVMGRFVCVCAAVFTGSLCVLFMPLCVYVGPLPGGVVFGFVPLLVWF